MSLFYSYNLLIFYKKSMSMNKLKSICLYRATDAYLNRFPKKVVARQMSVTDGQ